MRKFLLCSGLAMGLGLAPIAASAATILGEFWDASSRIATLDDALDIIATGPATATFDSSGIDYPDGDTNIIPDATTLADFLGSDAASLSGAQDTTMEQSVFRFTGFLSLDDADTLFSVGSDDGFQLTIDGDVISSFTRLRSFGVTETTANLGAGIFAFELIYWENLVETGVEFEINGETVTGVSVPTVVPLPASGLALLAGLAGFGVMRLRRARA